MGRTVEEAIKQLTTLKKNAAYAEALDMAIKALRKPTAMNVPYCYMCKHIDEPVDSEACGSCREFCNYDPLEEESK